MTDIVENLRIIYNEGGPSECGEAADEIERLRTLLQEVPCTCQWIGAASIPTHPTDYSTRILCPRCRALAIKETAP